MRPAPHSGPCAAPSPLQDSASTLGDDSEAAEDVTRTNSLAKGIRLLQARWAARQRRLLEAESLVSADRHGMHQHLAAVAAARGFDSYMTRLEYEQAEAELMQEQQEAARLGLSDEGSTRSSLSRVASLRRQAGSTEPARSTGSISVLSSLRGISPAPDRPVGTLRRTASFAPSDAGWEGVDKAGMAEPLPRLTSSISSVSASAAAAAAEPPLTVAEFDVTTEGKPWLRRLALRCQYRCYVLVQGPAFNQVFLLAILVNTLLLAIEFDGMSASLEHDLAVGAGWGAVACGHCWL